MKVYAGVPAAARHYVEADRGWADDYYLTEGTGLARRYTATDGGVQELAPLTGDGYQAWVAGQDPDTGEPRGRLRTDEHAVRFVEVVVNGPKSGRWPRRCTRTSPPPTTRPRTATPQRSSAGCPGTRPPGWGRAVGRCRCRWRCWRR